MDLGSKLLLIFVVFLALIGVVMAVSFRERKLANKPGASDRQSDEASDNRTMAIIFGGMPRRHVARANRCLAGIFLMKISSPPFPPPSRNLLKICSSLGKQI